MATYVQPLPHSGRPAKAQPVTRYELPPGGTSLLGYVVRRMHKTKLLLPVAELLAGRQKAEALAQIAIYAVAASTSFGPAYYQPRFDAVGAMITEPDPATGALITATLDSRSPHYRLSYGATLPNGSVFSGFEEMARARVSWRGVGTPAPSRFNFMTVDGRYTARFSGTITSELSLPLFLRTRVRAYGSLNFRDNAGNSGWLTLERNGLTHLSLTCSDGATLTKQADLAHL